jgi:DNA-binding HxlR family transcriptional regulator
MGERGGYGQFCPVSMAAEIVCTRWTALILREMFRGSTALPICARACRECRRRCCPSA